MNGIFVSVLHKILSPQKMKHNLLGLYVSLVCNIYMVKFKLWQCFYRLKRNFEAKKKKNEDCVPGPFPALDRLAMLCLGCRWAVASAAKEHWSPHSVS